MPLLSEVTLSPLQESVAELEPYLKVDYSDLPSFDDSKLDAAQREAKLSELKRKRLFDAITVRLTFTHICCVATLNISLLCADGSCEALL